MDEIIPIVDSILEQDDKVSLSFFFAITDNVFEEKFTFQRFICLFFRIRTGTSTGLSLSPGKSRDSSVSFFHFFLGISQSYQKCSFQCKFRFGYINTIVKTCNILRHTEEKALLSGWLVGKSSFWYRKPSLNVIINGSVFLEEEKHLLRVLILNQRKVGRCYTLIDGHVLLIVYLISLSDNVFVGIFWVEWSCSDSVQNPDRETSGLNRPQLCYIRASSYV